MNRNDAIDLAHLKSARTDDITAMAAELEGSPVTDADGSTASDTPAAVTGWQGRFLASGKVTAPANPRAGESGSTTRSAWQRRFVASGKVAPAPVRG